MHKGEIVGAIPVARLAESDSSQLSGYGKRALNARRTMWLQSTAAGRPNDEQTGSTRASRALPGRRKQSLRGAAETRLLGTVERPNTHSR